MKIGLKLPGSISKVQRVAVLLVMQLFSGFSSSLVSTHVLIEVFLSYEETKNGLGECYQNMQNCDLVLKYMERDDFLFYDVSYFTDTIFAADAGQK